MFDLLHPYHINCLNPKSCDMSFDKVFFVCLLLLGSAIDISLVYIAHIFSQTSKLKALVYFERQDSTVLKQSQYIVLPTGQCLISST